MADQRKNGAVCAAASWCANNLLKRDLCSPECVKKFKNVLTVAIRQELNIYNNPNPCCVLQIRNGRPNELLSNAMEKMGIDKEKLTAKDIMILVYLKEVFVVLDSLEDDSEGASEESKLQCIFKSTRTSDE